MASYPSFSNVVDHILANSSRGVMFVIRTMLGLLTSRKILWGKR
jgi:hypothetical protein